MSYAQVIVRFANVSNAYVFVEVETSIKLGSGTYGLMYGYPGFSPRSKPDGCFAISALSFATAESYRSKFLQAYGPNGTFSQNDITVSPVMASTDPNKPHYIIIDFNYYVGETVTINAEPPVYMSVTQESLPTFEVLSHTIGVGANC